MMSASENSNVVAAAQWLADQKEPPAMAVPLLREKFGFSALEACEAIKLAQDFRICRRAFG